MYTKVVLHKQTSLRFLKDPAAVGRTRTRTRGGHTHTGFTALLHTPIQQHDEQLTGCYTPVVSFEGIVADT